MSDASVLVVKHVPWEGPHRIAEALEACGLALDVRCPIEGDQLPPHDRVAGAVFMGGPMNVDEIDMHPGLLAERVWLAEAISVDMPVLGVCLGSQLIARSLGAAVRPGGAPEIGWKTVTVQDDQDPLMRHLAPAATVLHWHGDVFDLPASAKYLASSEQTEVQAFRVRNAWGMLFHPEADAALVDRWLSEETMALEAEAALGVGASDRLRLDAAKNETELKAVSEPLFAAFGELLAATS